MMIDAFAAEHGIEIPTRVAEQVGHIPVFWNPRMKSTAGRAHFIWNGRPQKITMNPKLKGLENAAAEIRQTFLHEVAHLLAGAGQGHGAKWKRMARSLGIPPRRCHPHAWAKRAPRFVWAVCKGCGHQFTAARVRKPRAGPATHTGCGADVTIASQRLQFERLAEAREDAS